MQEDQFRNNGYLFRSLNGDRNPRDLNVTGARVEVTIPYGRLAWIAFESRRDDGSFCNGIAEGFPGVRVNPADPQTVARNFAFKHFDDPVLVTATVPPGIIQNGLIFQNYVGDFNDRLITEVEMGVVDNLARVDIKPLYTGMSVEQVNRLETLLFERMVPPRPSTEVPPPPPQPPTEPVENPNSSGTPVKKVVWAAAAILIGYLFVKHVGPKVSKWMSAEPSAPLTKK